VTPHTLGDIVHIEMLGATPETAPYQAGACNIGPAEIARRRRTGWFGVAAAVGVGLFLLAVDAPPVARLLVFPPLAAGLVSLEQARRRFCVGFAMLGVRNFGPLGSTESVADAADRAADRRAALRLMAIPSAIALGATLVFAALPI
jgi:hypothetical protein